MNGMAQMRQYLVASVRFLCFGWGSSPSQRLSRTVLKLSMKHLHCTISPWRPQRSPNPHTMSFPHFGLRLVFQEVRKAEIGLRRCESSMCLHPRPISDTACNGQSIMRVVASFTKLFTVIFKAGFWPRALSADLIMRAETVSLNSCIRLFASSMDCSPPGSSVHGILQARILELAAFPFSRGSSPPRH